VIASVGLGEEEEYDKLSYEERSTKALRDIIRETKKLTDKPFGVNIMCALKNYDQLVRVCLDEKVAIIFSGAGLPLRLPSLVKGSNVALVPIVSSGRAAGIITRAWLNKYNRLPDGFVVEGPLAGGHLGYKFEELIDIKTNALQSIFHDVKKVVNNYDKKDKIAIVVAGGIFNGEDIAYFLKEGASGVQMATRFIGTRECDAADEFKQEVIKSKKEDTVIINSPVQMPGRVIMNAFVKKIISGEHIYFECKYHCLKTCDSEHTQYCIAKALVSAYRGDMKNGFVMAGVNSYRVNKIVGVKELISELTAEAEYFYFKKV
jgi:NAD(P)H-dependent flavin oxidoreductase YrpB (nitropropane dioxygenase family)